MGVGVISCSVLLGSPPSLTLPRKGGGNAGSLAEEDDGVRGGNAVSLAASAEDASLFATSSLFPRVDARARCAAASPPARRSQELSGGGCSPVPEPVPASPRLIAGLSSSASTGPIGRTSGRPALVLWDLPGFLGRPGVFAMRRIWAESGVHERAKGRLLTARCQELSASWFPWVAALSVFVMAGHSRSKNGVASARLCPGHPRLPCVVETKTWMPATSAGMTSAW